MHHNKVKNGILILGVERSGTSLIANLVSDWGATGGWRSLYPGDKHNPRGYFEDQYAEELLAYCLQVVFDRFGSHIGWEEILDVRLQELQNDHVFKVKLRNFLKEISGKDEIWFWKSPFLSVTEALWSDFIETPVILVPVRNPVDTIESIISFRGRTGDDEEKLRLALFWQHYLQRSLTVAKKTNKALFIQYEKIVKNPSQEIERLVGFLGSHFVDIGEFHQCKDDMVDTIDAKLHRNKSIIDTECQRTLTETQVHLYQQLIALATDKIHLDSVQPSIFCLTDNEKVFLRESDTTVFLG